MPHALCWQNCYLLAFDVIRNESRLMSPSSDFRSSLDGNSRLGVRVDIFTWWKCTNDCLDDGRGMAEVAERNFSNKLT